MSPVLDLQAKHLALVQDILQGLAPAGSTVWVFGSRVRGQARKTSDLDLAIDTGCALSFSEAAALADAFDEAPLPFRVDVVDMHSISPEFKAVIERDRFVLPGFSEGQI